MSQVSFKEFKTAMNILGIHDGHNAAACLLRDGEIVAAVQEERIVREKNWAGFPHKSVQLGLETAGLEMGDIDFVAMNGHHIPPPKDRLEVMHEYRRTATPAAGIKRLLKRTPAKKIYLAKRKRERLEALRQAGFADLNRVEFVEHHLAHASAAYFGWGRMDEDILVLTNDGGGDYVCATVHIGRDGDLKRVASVSDSESIGNIYAMTTYLMGMVPLEHEYKLMGMAPYAPDSGRDLVYDKLRRLFAFGKADGGLTWRRANGCPETYFSYQFLSDLYHLCRFDWVCAGVQRMTEELLEAWVRNCIKTTGIHKVALSGGVFMNVKANKRLMELPEVEEIYIYPSCGDETNAMGAAYWVHARENHAQCRFPHPTGPFYFGPDIDDEEVSFALAQYSNRDWKVEQVDDIDRQLAEILAEGEIAARCRGPMEFGARALGNRSILADPANPDVVRVINDMIKCRDFWMPFAPAMLEERAGEYLRNPKQHFSPYMIMSFDSTEKESEFRSAIHPYDRTARPQVVRKSWNSEFHELLSHFAEKTGRGVLLNTSFNMHGYPMVMTPADALHVFDKSGLKNLAVGSFLVRK